MIKTKFQSCALVAITCLFLVALVTVTVAEDDVKDTVNIVANSGFEEETETGIVSWGFWSGGGSPDMGVKSPGKSGEKCGYIKGNSKEDYGVCYQTLTLKPKTKYRVVIWYRYETETGNPGCGIQFAGKKVVLTPCKTEWTKKSFSVTTGDNTSDKFRITLYQRENTLYFDDVEVFEE